MQWKILIPTSERSRNRLQALARSIFSRLSFSLIFPYFLNCILPKHTFFFFLSGTSPFLSRNRHSRSQLPKHGVCLSFVDIALTFKSIKMSKCGGEALTKKLTKPEKRKKKKKNPKKPDQIRSMMDSVGTKPRRVTRDVKSVSQ